jgi:predicted acyl esterase
MEPLLIGFPERKPMRAVSKQDENSPLFMFDYVWEVYKPEPQRRWGYYVLPVFYGDRFVARLDGRLERGVWTITRWWWEPDVTPTADWEAKRPGLERIEVPALVCASWSDHGLHTRGSLEGFERIASAQKWLYTHGGRKWERFYASEMREVQRRFFDHFLKGEPNGWETTPRVRLAVRRSW